MNFVEINGITPCVHYTKNGTIDFTQLMHDIINNDDRNKIIATHVLVRYKMNFVILVAHLNHAHLIANKLQSCSIQIINHTDLDSNLKLHSQIIFMDFNTFDLIEKLKTPHDKLLQNYHGLIIAYPHKNIKNILEYIHRNKLKVIIYDIDDNNELLSIWNNDHCSDFELYKVLHHIK